MSPLIDINQKKSLWDVQWIKRERERNREWCLPLCYWKTRTISVRTITLYICIITIHSNNDNGQKRVYKMQCTPRLYIQQCWESYSKFCLLSYQLNCRILAKLSWKLLFRESNLLHYMAKVASYFFLYKI